MSLTRLLVLLPTLLAGFVFATTDDEIVRRFEAISIRFAKALNDSPPYISPPDGRAGYATEWYRRKLYTPPVSFDVQKTNSLVSPLIGEIVFGCNVRGARASSENELKVIPDSFDNTSQCKASYAYQSSRWRFRTLSCLRSSATQRQDIWQTIDPTKETTVSVYGRCHALLPSE